MPVRLDAGEALTAECVNAEVQVGDQRIPPAQLRIRFDLAAPDSGVIRITTSSAIDEPVVTVNVSAGCVARVSRRFVVLADPGVNSAADMPATAAVAPLVAPVVVSADAYVAAVSTPSVAPAQAVAAARQGSGKLQIAERRAAPKRRPVAAKARAARAQSSRVAAAPQPRQQAQPRLQLDAAEPTLAATPAVVEEAFEAVAQAASAARASAAAASAAAERIVALELGADKLRVEAGSSRAAVEQLRAQLATAQDSSTWLVPLLAVLALLVAAAAWLAWRLQTLQRSHELAWARASIHVNPQAPLKETSPLPLINSLITMPPPLGRGGEAALATTAAMPMAPPSDDIDAIARERATMRTAVLPAGARVDENAPRDVSIDELLDLEQQAEFFVALGQDSAAIELLVAHLRNTGGGSPLTYLKLLEIYRRCGDHEAYERTRARFNHRYNAYAPDWGSDLMHGKSLDDYLGVLPRLQQAWSRPLDAMAELEALLFRKSRGELFELPAYREVLLLYSVARDLLDREPVDVGNVDLLLPLDASSERRHVVGSSRAVSDISEDERPTAPVDLDLTPPHATESIFGETLRPSHGVGSGRSRE